MKSQTALTILGSLLGSALAFGQAPAVRDVTVTEIPGIVGPGSKWTIAWQTGGNNADGIVGTLDGGLWIAQNDNSQVMKLDGNDRASVYITNTNTGGSLSADTKGRLLLVQRAAPMTVTILSPERKVLADTFQGKPLTELGRLNDLVADSKGGAYFTAPGTPPAIPAGVFYASSTGQVARFTDDIRPNGITLSRDEKILYVTNGMVVVAFDVQPDGTVTNRRDFARLEGGGGGDGMAIDAAGRLYVTAQAGGIQVFSPEGKYLGQIPTPRNSISVAFSGPDKKTLYFVGLGALGPDGAELTPRGATIYKMPILAQGFPGRAK